MSCLAGAQDSLLPNAAMTYLERVLNEILQPTIRSLKRMTIPRDNRFHPWMDSYIGQCKTCPNYLDLLMSWVVKFMNKVLYAREGARSMMDWTFVDFPGQVRVDVDVFEIKVLEDAEGVLVANIESYLLVSLFCDGVTAIANRWGSRKLGGLHRAPDNFAAAAARNPVCNLGLMNMLEAKMPFKFIVMRRNFLQRLLEIHGDESLNMIDIPSTRPKKNPLHPYPRKMVDSPVANKAVLGQPENSPSPNISGRESRSPDSILLEIGSGVSEYPVSEQQNSRFSPASCTKDVHTAYIIFAE
ncbi:hypothetical protein CQW23_07082 [Capsicum baccatum]|uniref:Diacylglycerol kinase accessory domain-containing protein n=1 Tax=Capsicum baccatum TaxID=33114 RepID=A0A2G2X590_CAPBA|nr:hypothetical protein CQW23_07082 [Capsicum baccatum]